MNFAFIGHDSDLYPLFQSRFGAKNDQLQLYPTLDAIVAERFTDAYDAIIIDFDTRSSDYNLRLIQCLKIFNGDISIFVIMSDYHTETVEKMFSLGISDCYKKTSDPEELVIRIRNNSFNTAINKQLSHVRIGENYVYNTYFSILYYKNIEQRFSKNEAAFLRLLIENHDCFISLEDIAGYVYQNYSSIESATIRSLISRLRKKLKEDFIESVHGYGYRLKI